MNNTFNLRRFSLLFSKHTIEFYKTYLISITVLLGLLAVILGFACYVGSGSIREGFHIGIFSCFFLGAGSIFTSMIFSDFGDKRKSISILTLPVSHFEKYLVAWLYSFVIFQLIFVLSFYAVDYVVLLIGNSGKSQGLKMINVFSGEQHYTVVFLCYAIFHGLTFLGGIFFEKIHFIKTAFVSLICVVLATLINQPILDALFDVKLEKVAPFKGPGLWEGGQYYEIQPLHSIEPVMFGLSMACVVLLWIGAYFKLKEKEV